MKRDNLHPVLKRQIDKCAFYEEDNNERLSKLITMVNKSYDEADQLRYLKERAVEVSSQEMREMNDVIQKEKNALQEAYNDLVEKERLINERNAELAAQKSYASSLITSIADMLIVLDNNYTITDVNDSFWQQFFSSKESIIGKNINNVLATIQPIIDLINSTQSQPEKYHSVNYQTDVIVDSKNITPVLVSAAIILDDKKRVNGVICIAKDISELTKLEKENAEKMALLSHAGRLAALGEMATGIAHELNQPLSIIRTDMQALELIRKDLLSEEDVKDIISSAIRQVDRASNIINHMRSFAGKKQGACESIDIREPIRSALGMFNEQFRLHEINIKCNFDNEIPQIFAESQQIEQLVVNLVSNARYAVEEMREKKGKQFEMKIDLNLMHDKGKKVILFDIIDNGTGMSEDVLEHCMEAFYTTKKVGEGTGLMIVYNIIKNINAALKIKSELDNGTTISIEIPTGG